MSWFKKGRRLDTSPIMIAELMHQILVEEDNPQAAPEFVHLPEAVRATATCYGIAVRIFPSSSLIELTRGGWSLRSHVMRIGEIYPARPTADNRRRWRALGRFARGVIPSDSRNWRAFRP